MFKALLNLLPSLEIQTNESEFESISLDVDDNTYDSDIQETEFIEETWEYLQVRHRRAILNESDIYIGMCILSQTYWVPLDHPVYKMLSSYAQVDENYLPISYVKVAYGTVAVYDNESVYQCVKSIGEMAKRRGKEIKLSEELPDKEKTQETEQ